MKCVQFLRSLCCATHSETFLMTVVFYAPVNSTGQFEKAVATEI